MKRARLIYNPSAGREQVKRQLPYILERLEKAEYESSSHATTGSGDAIKAARLASERNFDLVIAAGGDGTINEVINGLAEQSHRPKLGIIPAGTSNDFARELGIPKSIDVACDVICGGYEIPIDIGKVADKYFVNVAAGGTLTELTYEVPSKLKTIIGQMAYYVKGLEKLPDIHPFFARIEYDDNIFEGKIMLFLVLNTRSTGGIEKLAPNASLNDGKFDLLILKESKLAEFVRIFSSAVRGEHIHDKAIIYVQASKIKIKAKEEVQLNLDGEYGGLLPSQIINLKHHFKICVPKSRYEIYVENDS